MNKILELKKIAKDKKLTYKEIAARSGVPEGSIKNIFTNPNRNPRIDTIEKIERALGLSTVTDEEYQAGVREYVVRNITADEDDLLEDYRELGIKKGAAAQKAARDVIKAMLGVK